jgi:vancomycin resistance protein VanW
MDESITSKVASTSDAASDCGCEHDRMRALVTRKQRFSERHPSVYPLAVWVHRTRRRMSWVTSRTDWATSRIVAELPVRIKPHKSLLLRQLGESEMYLQHNKVTNLAIAAGKIDGLLIQPGETFSFNRVVGNCTRRRGYVEGMRLSNGEAAAGVGGGICQLANLLHWMVLHSDLTVTERSEHSFDPFPDNGRVLPWGTGCSIVYNYVDLQFRNDTDRTYQLRVKVGERYLEGQLRADSTQQLSYSVESRAERFYRLGTDYFRANQIWRTQTDRRTGNTVGEELVRRNCALVKYVPTDVEIEVIDGHPGAVIEDPRRWLTTDQAERGAA